MRILSGRAAEAWVKQLAARSSQFGGAVEPRVRKIVDDVRRNGDRALRKYAAQWDGLKAGDPLRISAHELQKAWKEVSPPLRAALQQAAANIRQFCEWQKPKEWRRTKNGISLGVLVRPLDSVGCYVPSGRYPLVSTLLMTVIPAQVAGVKNIRVVSPRPRPEVLAAAGMLGVTEFYLVGGAQAIAALAYGTSSTPRVDKIVGPGNLFVTVAKKLVSFDCAIDMLAGPTEALIVSDEGHPQYIAADLVCQAEHDPETQVAFITTKRRLADAVALCVKQVAEENPIAKKSLAKSGAILIASSKALALDWANRIASEHLTVSSKNVASVQNAGSVFVGDYSAQAAGDYASGPNHVLPTAGAARFRGGLSVMDFVKLITVQELSRSGLRRIAPAIQTLALTEELPAHAASVRIRSEAARA
jgi:histidinol dehydrogenase